MKLNYAAVLGERIKLIDYYLEIFNEIPSASHLIRVYTFMEKVFLDKYDRSEITLDEKLLNKFDKLKSMALNNSNIPERKLAFYNSVKIYMKMTDVKLTIPEEFK